MKVSISTWVIWIASVSLLAVCIYGCVALIKAPERWAREHMRHQISEIQAGRQEYLSVSNETGEVQRDEFLKSIGTLRDSNRFLLAVEYSSDTDKFLHRIAGLVNVRELILATNDVTDAGMADVAKLPNLESLTLFDVRVSDAGIKQLHDCPKLESLEFKPRQGTAETIPILLELPHLHQLRMYTPYQSDWLQKNIKQFEEAKSLTKLDLIGEFPPDEIQALRDKLPHCKVNTDTSRK